jgi:hypothetical protein
MKNCIASIVGIVVLAGFLAAQPVSKEVSSVSAVSVELGSRTVRIPAPDRFTDSLLHFPRIAARLMAAESPMNEVLAVHVTDEIVPVLKDRQDPDLPFYTKASVLKEFKNIDVEAAEFQSLAADFEKLSPGSLQSIAKNAEQGTGERLNHHWGTETSLRIGETRMLGYFDKQPQSISSLFIMNAEMFNRKLLILGSMSLVYVNKRVLFLYVFRVPDSADDQSMVTSVTRSWTAKTIAANK